MATHSSDGGDAKISASSTAPCFPLHNTSTTSNEDDSDSSDKMLVTPPPTPSIACTPVFARADTINTRTTRVPDLTDPIKDCKTRAAIYLRCARALLLANHGAQLPGPARARLRAKMMKDTRRSDPGFRPSRDNAGENPNARSGRRIKVVKGSNGSTKLFLRRAAVEKLVQIELMRPDAGEGSMIDRKQEWAGVPVETTGSVGFEEQIKGDHNEKTCDLSGAEATIDHDDTMKDIAIDPVLLSPDITMGETDCGNDGRDSLEVSGEKIKVD